MRSIVAVSDVVRGSIRDAIDYGVHYTVYANVLYTAYDAIDFTIESALRTVMDDEMTA